MKRELSETRAALYARYSSEGQREASIDDQYRNCERVAAHEGWSIVERYQDKAISGSQNASGRPGYRQMLADAQAKRFDVLLVDDFSRLSRDQVETETARRRFVHWGIRLIGVSDGIDTAAKGHKMLSGFKGLMNDFFLDDLRDKTKRGMIGQVLKGYHGGGRSYGYRLVPEYDSTKRDPYGQPMRIGTRLEIDPEQARWVKWIFEQYADGLSPVKIVEELNRREVPPPGMAYRRRSAQPPTWCASALYGNVKYGLGLLNNSLYRGEVVWGRSRWEKDPDTKKKRRFLCEESEWVRHHVDHLRVIDDSIWERVKARQKNIHEANASFRAAHNIASTTSTGRGPKYLFSSLLSCGQCGHRFVIVDPKRYACSGWLYRGVSVCNNTIKVSRQVLESVLLESIQRDLFTQEGFALFKQEVLRLVRDRQQNRRPDRQKLEDALATTEQEIENIMKAIKAGIITKSTKSELEKAEAARASMQHALKASAKSADPVAPLLSDLKDRFRSLVNNVSVIAARNVEKARGALKELLAESIKLHPCSSGQERYLTAEITGNYVGLMQMAGMQNKGGGGQAFPPSSINPLDPIIQGLALIA